MGNGNWSNTAYSSLKSTYANKSTRNLFANTANYSIADDMKPYNLKIRESRDSDEHPNSIAISIFLDVTGSMGSIPDSIVREELGTLMGNLASNNIEDPQLMFCAVGDHTCDSYPIV